MMDIDSLLLTRTARDILFSDLRMRGNTLSDMHGAALYELLDAFTGYVIGTERGRKAFPLPTGLGKTSAAVAFLTALHRLGYEVPVSVAASKVAALSQMKRDVMAHGVPEYLIGLKHSVLDLGLDLLPSTGNESRLFQFVTHARVRGGSDFELFGEHGGERRALCIYDETFMRCDAFAFSARSFFAAVGVMEAIGDSRDGTVRHLMAYLAESAETIRRALEDLRRGGDPENVGTAIHLAALEPATVEAFRGTVARHSSPLRGFAPELDALLAQSQDTLRVIRSEQGDGLVTARDAVPAALRNVVILDASAPIRELVKLDPSVTIVESFDMATLKSFEQVEVHQLVSPGGRNTISHSLRADRKEVSAVAQEVAGIIKAGWDIENAFLVFTFKKAAGLDMVSELRRDLTRLGIDVDAKTSEGQPRMNWLTWGSETSLNGFEHCTGVIMAGVLHRNHLDLAANLKGQTANPAEPAPNSRIKELIETEIGHCLYQGASRGSCRRIDQGKAKPMRLWFIHRNPGIKSILDKVMPGAEWHYPDPQFLKAAAADSKAAQLLGHLLVHLQGLPETITKVSSRQLKEALELPQTTAIKLAFSRAVALLEPGEHGWALQGRSLVREAVAYGFESQT